MIAVRASFSFNLFFHTAYRFLSSVPVVCFLAAFATDLAYWKSAEMMWADFSAWLLTIGLIFGAIAGICFLIDVATDRSQRANVYIVASAITSSVAWILSLINDLVHTRDAWTSVVPGGLLLSCTVAGLFLVAVVVRWLSWRSARRAVVTV